MDITKPDQIADAEQAIREHNTGLYGLVNNAGISILGRLMTLSDEDLERQFQTNFFGVHRITRTMFPLIAASHGHCDRFVSQRIFRTIPNNGPYCSQNYMEKYSDSLRKEISSQGVNVSIIEPGLIKTKIWDKAAGLIGSSQARIKRN